MYSTQVDVKNSTFMTHIKRACDAHNIQTNDQEHKDDDDTDMDDASDPAHITTVPFSTTKVGSFQ